jgi:hypothetical protein
MDIGYIKNLVHLVSVLILLITFALIYSMPARLIDRYPSGAIVHKSRAAIDLIAGHRIWR